MKPAAEMCNAVVPAAPFESGAGTFARWIVPAVIVLGTAICYANSFNGVFVFDDRQYVANNPAIQSLWPPYDWIAFCPTRPLVYFTFAVNYALGAENPFGYHLVNLLIHTATALLLYGLIRRSLQQCAVKATLRRRANLLAAASALIWAVHPLCTQAVTYVYQRLESLAALFAVLACYAFVRAYADPQLPRRRWSLVVVVACFAAMLCKESVAAVPIILLLYDRTFFSRSWREVRRRSRMHAAAFCSWGVALALVIATGDAYAKSGITNVPGLTPLNYALSQSGVLLRYLQLVVWPTGQCLDYGWQVAEFWYEFVPQTIVILAALAVTFVGVYRGRTWSFPAAAFFLLLAPTSSIIPIADLIFEHRMYLPAACIVVLLVCGENEALERCVPRIVSRTVGFRVTAVGFSVILFALGTATVVRNRVYAEEMLLWQEIVDKAPHHPRGPYLIGSHYQYQRRFDLAEKYLDRSIELAPLFVPSHIKRSQLLLAQGRIQEVELPLTTLLSLIESEPLVGLYAADIYAALGSLREDQERFDEAVQWYLKSIQERPDRYDAMSSLGLLLTRLERKEEAFQLFGHALELNPRNAAAHNNLGVLHHKSGRIDEAAVEFRLALEIAPEFGEARANLGSVLDKQGRGEAALAELRRAVEVDDECIGGHINLATALARRGQFEQSLKHAQRAVELDPRNATARANLAQVKRDLAAKQPGISATATP